MLLLSDIFKKDVSLDTTNLHPVVVIESTPKIYLSQTDEVLDGHHFKAVNLKIPSINESVDLESRKFRINNITITFSNYDNFSDIFASEHLLDVFVKVYWVSQNCTTIDDCLLVYKAVIKRIDHDYKNVKLVLEDLTEAIVHKQIPINIVDESVASSEKYKNVVAPMVYGEVDRAPCVLYEVGTENVGTLFKRYTMVTPDAIDTDLSDFINKPQTGHSFSSSGSSRDTPLFIFTGRYLNVMKEYWYNVNSTHSFYESQWDDFTDTSRVRFQEVYQQEIPFNPIADNLMQVTVLRKAKTASLIDSDGAGYSYLGAENDIYIQNPEALVDFSTYDYDSTEIDYQNTWATIPDSSLNSVESFELDDDGFAPITFFRNGHNAAPTLSNSNYDYPLSRWGTSESSSGWWHPNYSGNTFRSTWHQLMYDLHELDAEIICLPDSKKLYDWSKYYALTNLSGGSGIYNHIFSWSTGTSTINRSRFNNTVMKGFEQNQNSWWSTLGIYGIEWHNYFTHDHAYQVGIEDNPQSFVDTNMHWTQVQGANYQDFVPFPLPMFQISLIGAYEDEESLWLTWSKDYQGTAYTHEDYTRLPRADCWTGEYDGQFNEPKTIDFWDVMEQNGYVHAENPNFDPNIHSDLPRFKIVDLQYRSFGGANWVANYEALWNLIDVNIYNNTGQNGGYVNDNLNGHYGYYSDTAHYAPFCVYDSGNVDYGGEGNQINGLHNEFHANIENYYVHFKSDTIIQGGGVPIKVRKGTMFPYRVLEYSSTNRVKGTFFHGELYNYNQNYMNMQAGSAFGSTQRLAIVYTLEDSGVSDNIHDTTITHPVCAIKVKSYQQQPTNNLASNSYLKINWLEGEVEGNNFNTNLVGVIESFSTEYINDNSNTPEGIEIINTFNDQNVLSSTVWSNPDDFNSGIIRYELQSNVAGGHEFQFNTRVGYLGIMHLLEVSDVYKQDYYMYTGGRSCSGVTNATYKNSSVIIEDIIKKELEVEFSKDYSWDTVKANLGANWMLAFSQTDRIESKKLIEGIAKSTPLVPLIKSNYKLAATVIGDDYNSTNIQSDNQTIKALDVISSSFTRTKIEKVKTMVRVRFKKDYARNSFSEKTLFVDAYDFYGNGNLDYPGGYKKDYYGLSVDTPGDSVLDVENEYIRDINVANNLRNFLLAYYCNQHNIIKLKLPIKYVDLEVTDIIEFDSLIQNQLCYGEDYTTTQQRNGQEILPYFMITSIRKNIDSISLTCEQMHNLNRNDSIISVGSGDVARNGTYSSSEDINELVQYLAGNRPYFTEGQLKNSDINGDKLVNDDDLALMEQLLSIEEDEEDIGSSGEDLVITELHETYFTENVTSNTQGFNSLNNIGVSYFKKTYDDTASFITDDDVLAQEFLNVGYYMVLENINAEPEICQITNSVMIDDNTQQITYSRGLFYTEISTHSSGTRLRFYDSEPIIEGVTNDDFTLYPNFTSYLVAHETTTGNGQYGIMNAEPSTDYYGLNSLSFQIWMVTNDFSDMPNDFYQVLNTGGNPAFNADNFDNSWSSRIWMEDWQHNIFLDHPECWDGYSQYPGDPDWYLSHGYELSDYTGSDYSYEEGDKAISKPFIGWYMKVGDEWMKIKRQTLSISGMTVNDVVSYATITIQVQRGYFGTELVEHEEGELIQVFDTLPNGFVDDEET